MPEQERSGRAGSFRGSGAVESIDWEEMFRDSPVGIAVVDDEGRPLGVNDAFVDMIGYSPDELRGMSFMEFTHLDDVQKDVELYEKLVAGEIPHYRIDKRYVTASGEVMWAELYVTTTPTPAGSDARFVAFVRDITDRRRAEERYRSLFENSRDAIVLTDREGNFRRVNDAFVELTGYSRSELEELRAQDLYEDPGRRQELLETLEDSGYVQGFELQLRRADGRLVYCTVTTNLRPGPEGRRGIQAIIRDVTAQKELEEELRQQALHDSLTGLPNRTLLHDRLDQALARIERSPEACLAVLFLDLDGFKAVNDRHGHEVGDQMLRRIAARLSELVRDGDTVARFGGDEFVVLLHELEGVEETELVARRICDGVGGVEPAEASPTGLTMSIGIALVAADDLRGLPREDVLDDPSELIRWADRAMYRAKEAGGCSYRYSRPGDGDRAEG